MNNLFYFFFGFAGGILVEGQWSFGWSLALAGLFLSLVFGFYYLRTKENFFWLALILCLGLILGVSRLALVKSWHDDELEPYLDRAVTLSGVVVAEPDERESSKIIVIKPEGYQLQISAFVPREVAVTYGAEVKLTGVLARASDRAPLEIDYEVKQPKLEVLGQSLAWRRPLFWLKHQFLTAINKVVVEPAAGLLGGLLFGEKHALPVAVTEDFRRVGLSHIIVLSGYNLTLVADSLLKVFSFLPRQLGYGLGAFGIILFTIMTGAGAATVRAALMALVALLARATGREYQATIALLAAGFLMLLYEPRLLTGDPGFQLSWLATFGLINFSPLIERFFNRFFPRFQRPKFIREITVSTIAVQIFILPWVLFKFGAWSLVALPANLLVLPVIPATMFFGFITGLFGFVSSLLAWPFGLITYLLLQYQLLIVKFFAAWPGASIIINNFSAWLVLIAYLIYSWLILWHSQRSRSSLPVGQANG